MTSFPARPAVLADVRRAAAEAARAAGARESRQADVVAAVHEAAANAIVHGYRGEEGTIEITFEPRPAGLVVRVADHGQGFRPRRNTPGLGLGLSLIAQLADELQVGERATGGVEVVMRFALA